ncbi:MAG TPA: hypothetical protein VIR56_02760 [Solimonas sp.]
MSDKKSSAKPKREQPQKVYGPQSRSGSGHYGGGRPQKSAEHRAGKSRKVH